MSRSAHGSSPGPLLAPLCLGLILSAGCSADREAGAGQFACGNGGLCVDAGPSDGGRPDATAGDGGPSGETCGFTASLGTDGVRIGTTADNDNALSPPTCSAGSGAPDEVVAFTVPFRLEQLLVSSEGTSFDSVLTLFRGGCEARQEVGCSDDIGTRERASRIELNQTIEPGDYYVLVDGKDTGSAGFYRLVVEGRIANGDRCDPQNRHFVCGSGFCASNGNSHSCVVAKDCADGFDTDGDGATDEDTSACTNAPSLSCADGLRLDVDASANLSVSVNPPNAVQSRRWTLIEQPDALFPGRFSSSSASPTALRDLMAGRYTYRHTVIDTQGQAVACQGTLTATTGGDLRVDLFWQTEGENADLDLLLIPPEATSWTGATVCSPATCTEGLSVGDAQSGEDDPVHGGNEQLGHGFEYISLPSPEQGGVGYRLGVFYANAYQGGATQAYLRVHCHGTLAATIGPVTLTEGALGGSGSLATNSFWKAADVVFGPTSCMVTPVSSSSDPVVAPFATVQGTR